MLLELSSRFRDSLKILNKKGMKWKEIQVTNVLSPESKKTIEKFQRTIVYYGTVKIDSKASTNDGENNSQIKWTRTGFYLILIQQNYNVYMVK